MDSFEFNKIAAAILIALLTIKGADLISEILVHPKPLKENVYKIEGTEVSTQAEGEGNEKKGPAPIEPLLAQADAKKGAEIFKKCMSCHTAEKGGPNKIGPDLYNVVGAPKAKHPGYTYSQAMENKGGFWSYTDLNVFLYSPRDFVPGTKMSFAGIKNDQDRADVIAYLRQQNDSPPPLPAVFLKNEELRKPQETPLPGQPSPEKVPAPASPPAQEAPKGKVRAPK